MRKSLLEKSNGFSFQIIQICNKMKADINAVQILIFELSTPFFLALRRCRHFRFHVTMVANKGSLSVLAKREVEKGFCKIAHMVVC